MENRLNKLWQRGIWHLRSGNLDAAQGFFEAMLARDPGHGPARFRLSMILARRGRHEEAIAMAEKLLLDEPHRAEIWTHLARCQLVVGQAGKALASAERALLEPTQEAVTLDSLGVIYSQLGDQTRALALFDSAIARQPDQASLHYNRALAYRADGQPEEAQRDLEACLALNPLHGKAHLALANLGKQSETGHHIERLQRLHEATLAAKGSDELVALALFKELDDLGRSDEAWATLEPLLQARRQQANSGSLEAGGLFDQLLQRCDAEFVNALLPAVAPDEQTPIFIVGMPRSGIALLGKLLGMHSQIHSGGTRLGFSRLLRRESDLANRDNLDAPIFDKLARLDYGKLGQRVRLAVDAQRLGKAHLCESEPMDFLMLPFIARALPEARFLHVVRDPLDTCLSILSQPGGDASLANGDPLAIADYYLRYQGLMQHWHEVLPGRILDVQYESLVGKPEMILRVVCAFLGLRFEAALRGGPRLHSERIGHWRRYAQQLEPARQRLRATGTST